MADKVEIIYSNIAVYTPIYNCLMKEQRSNLSGIWHEIERGKCKTVSGRTLTMKCSSSLAGTSFLMHKNLA